ncbi:MAG: hypothetical protein ACXAD7_03955 [Candidatus Kariarchaeaceae archaeon]|jgi:tetratricopeptide (TPR) repeat protein
MDDSYNEYEGLVFYNKESDDFIIDGSQLNQLVEKSKYDEYVYFFGQINDQTLKQVLRISEIYENRPLCLAYLDMLLSADLNTQLQFNLSCTRANLIRLTGKFAESANEFRKIEQWAFKQISVNELFEYGRKRFGKRNDKPYDEKTVIDWDPGTFYYYMAYSLYLAGKYNQALEYFSKSVLQRREQGDIRDLTRALIFLGLSYKKERDFDLASKYLLESIDLSVDITSYPIKILAIQNLVDVYIFNNDLERALHYVEIADSLNQQIDDPQSSANTFEMMARTYVYLGDLVKSKEYYLLSMNFHEITNNEPRLINSYFELFLHALQIEEIHDAKLYLEKLYKLGKTAQTYREVALLVYQLLIAKLTLSRKEHYNYNEAKTSLYAVLNQELIFPEYKMFASLNLLNCLIQQFRLNNDQSYIEEIKVLLPRIQQISTEFNIKSIQGIIYWVQYKISLIEQNIEKAIKFKKQANLISEISYVSKLDTDWIKDLQFDLNIQEIDQSEILDVIEKVIVNELSTKNYSREI